MCKFIDKYLQIESAGFNWKQCHKRINTLPQPLCILCNRGNFCWRKIKLSLSFHIRNKINKLILTEAFSKEGGGDIFYMMRLIKNHSLISGQHFTMPSFSQGKIRKKEVMIDD